ncbi:MAG: sensor histidine kinase [Streptosporangiaceae bacterium]|nr:sensor histidine kinase [Streptosporangiaceae bacterium]
MRHRLGLLLRRPDVPDMGMAVLLAALSLLTVWSLLYPSAGAEKKLASMYGPALSWRWHAVGWLAAVCAELAVLPLRRRFPVAVLAATLTMAAVHSLLLPATPAPADLAVAVAVYTVATTRPRPLSIAATAGGLLLVASLATLAIDLIAPDPASKKMMIAIWPVKPASMAVPILVLAAAWLAGDSARTRRDYVAEVERRAADAERDLSRQAELAAAAERERLTRELHDVIAHALSVMVIQAQGAGSALRRRRAGETGAALDAIVATGRGALSETRRVLGVVRRAADAEPELAPQPGLDDLSALAARVRGAGTPVRLRMTGQIRPLPGGIELSAYRIIQEALTNTMKHAGPGAAAVVTVHYAGADLLIEVTDDGAGATGGNGGADGRGLAGMRARVAMLGGDLEAGPQDGAGFGVRARLPVAETVGAETVGAE